ncbi:Serine/threonine protein kinase [Actinokineospora alba]|uniref:non-specific serine/threonine protein kinase n=1 Tax=Actinokineospora alba TaxID=504798 RepID=A0A1H0UJI8_9PSEU|nr:serine/threonine-protein kinase [Actinokineospora alba]TDP65035.1 serine/threonine protein kinase [Actinokineospora alba]SDH52443.1 Serine/threonine protein kinase [Actinokineospora alba]SDP66359.1 Serine/threonine protein kinase [Actinokineospora alba]
MRPGDLLDGRYRLGRLVGTGGMADVHEATDVRLGREVAVKLFRRRAEGETAARLDSEARLLGGLSHPGLLRVFDVAPDNDRPYLVMQLVRGRTLRREIDGGPLDPQRAARLGARLADTLAYVHSQGIMHRDVKPSNVLLSETVGCYLADFGIARAEGDERVTLSGHCVGTAAYLAPEQVQGEPCGPPADIYALGLMLIECLTGKPEYDGTDIEAAVARLRRDPRIPDGLPDPWPETLAAMTARDPADRPDAADCAQRLAAAALTGGRPLPPARPSTPPVSRQATAELPPLARPRTRATAVRVAAASAAVLLGGAAVAMSTQEPGRTAVSPPPATTQVRDPKPVPVVAVPPPPTTKAEPAPAEPAAEPPDKSSKSGKGKKKGKSDR